MTPLVGYEFTAEQYAKLVHRDQKYGDKEYGYHLEQVVAVLKRYTDEPLLIDAAWLHDVLEDTDTTYFQLARKFGPTAANIVWACTGVGESRKARQASILTKLHVFPGAPIVKLADRIANLRAGVDEGNKNKLSMYAKEHELFGSVVNPYVPSTMYQEYLKLIWS